MRRGPAALLAAVLVLGLGACGLPDDGASRRIEARAVPYGLLDAAHPEATAGPPTAAGELAPQVYLLDADQHLVAVPVTARGIGTLGVFSDLLDRLAQGPTDAERAQGLATALGPNVDIRVLGIVDGTARIDVRSAEKEPPANRLPLAIGQVVLTATSLPEIARVQVLTDGRPAEVPLPGGALTSVPLVRADYAALVAGALVAGAPPSPTGEATEAAAP